MQDLAIYRGLQVISFISMYSVCTPLWRNNPEGERPSHQVIMFSVNFWTVLLEVDVEHTPLPFIKLWLNGTNLQTIRVSLSCFHLEIFLNLWSFYLLFLWTLFRPQALQERSCDAIMYLHYCCINDKNHLYFCNLTWRRVSSWRHPTIAKWYLHYFFPTRKLLLQNESFRIGQFQILFL